MNRWNFAALAAAIFLIQTGSAPADGSLADGLRQCAAIADMTKRTACYDTLATSAQQTPSSFGRETTNQARADRRSEESDEIQGIAAKITNYTFTPFGKFVVVLDNGQIWQEQEGDSDRAHLSGTGNTISISRGAFGSYAAVINDGHHQFKVTRVK
jgi:hypothetical protein